MMSAVFAENKSGNAKDRQEVAKWGEYYAMVSRWETFSLFLLKDLQKVGKLTKAQKNGSDFMNLGSYDELREQFVKFLPELGALVVGLDCHAFNVVRDAGWCPSRCSPPSWPRSARSRASPRPTSRKRPSSSSPPRVPPRAGTRWAGGRKPENRVCGSRCRPKSSSTTAMGASRGAIDQSRSPSTFGIYQRHRGR